MVVRNAPEVQPGSKVRIAGVNVGKVKSTESGPGTFATITFELDDAGLPIHEDARVKIRPRTFLEGGMFLDLRPGTPDADELEEGGTIPVTNTSVAVLLGHATADLRLATRTNLRHLFNAINTAFEGDWGRGAPRCPAVCGAGIPRRRAGGRGSAGREAGDVSAGIEATGTTMAALASRDAQLADLLTGFNRTVRGLGSQSEELGHSLEELDDLLSEAQPGARRPERLLPARARVRDRACGRRSVPRPRRCALALPFLDQTVGLLSPAELPALLARPTRPFAAGAARGAAGADARAGHAGPGVPAANAIPALTTPIEDPPLAPESPSTASFSTPWSASRGRPRTSTETARRSATTSASATAPSRPQAECGEEIVWADVESRSSARARATPAQLPPFRPDVPCTSQDPPNLRAQTGPAPEQARPSDHRRPASTRRCGARPAAREGQRR